MFQITPRQLAALEATMLAQFIDEAVAGLRDAFPDRVRAMGAAALMAFVHQGIERAEQYGIGTVRDVRSWLKLMMILGERFDDDGGQPAIRSILLDANLTGAQRMSRILAMMGQGEI
jgi:hypothetical protein